MPSEEIPVRISWSEIQRNRLMALDAGEDQMGRFFEDQAQRDRAFQELEGSLAAKRRRELREMRTVYGRPALPRLETRLVEALVNAGFVQVTTPTIMKKGLLDRMGVSSTHPLSEQVFWLSEDQCLRPMLAPHLYFVVKDLLRLWEPPVGIFEIGSCFRKDSQGARHSNEFTMLNLCEFGLPEDERRGRLQELTELVMGASGVGTFRLEAASSTVYGETLDVLSKNGLELGSGAMGPHPLDRAWRITHPWVGVGFGLERLLMTADGRESIGRVGRSLAYLDGIVLKL